MSMEINIRIREDSKSTTRGHAANPGVRTTAVMVHGRDRIRTGAIVAEARETIGHSLTLERRRARTIIVVAAQGIHIVTRSLKQMPVLLLYQLLALHSCP